MQKDDIILIHGWDASKYTKLCRELKDDIAWGKRREFIRLLSEHFNVQYFNLPGFCGQPEPLVDHWDIEDFSKALHDWIKVRSLHPRAVIGYSFGGAVALIWKESFRVDTPIVLISPALFRASSRWTKIGGQGAYLLSGTNVIRRILKHCYLYVVNRYYRNGTDFLRKTYDRIVRRDLRKHLETIPANEVLLVFGNNDTATPWAFVGAHAERDHITSCVINSGGHAIGQTHPAEVTKAIEGFLLNPR